jgi:hypothetical protein
VTTVDDLLAGGSLNEEIEIPASVLKEGGRVVLRPLTLLDVQRIQKAGKESESLTSALMVKEAMVEPKVTLDQVNRMQAGLVEFLVKQVNRISGLSMSRDELEAHVQAPIARACYVLAREFGWTPQECAELTLGQVLLYLEMAGKRS